ncbi:MAG: MOSC domain-containing protein [Archangium sp.]
MARRADGRSAVVKLLSAFLYPVKSMRGIEVSSIALDALGVIGDRRWMVVDPENQFLTQRAVPALVTLQPALRERGLDIDDGGSVLNVEFPSVTTAARRRITIWRDTFEALDAGDEAAAWLSQRLGRACRLVHFASDVRRAVDTTYALDAQTSFTDAYPLLIVNETSLDALNATLSVPIPMNRFRPNLVVRGTVAWEEDGWSKLTVGGIPMDGVKPCARCVAITTDQHSGEKPQGSEPLSRLAELHTLALKTGSKGAMFGMNLVHRAQGTIHVGAPVEIG